VLCLTDPQLHSIPLSDANLKYHLTGLAVLSSRRSRRRPRPPISGGCKCLSEGLGKAPRASIRFSPSRLGTRGPRRAQDTCPRGSNAPGGLLATDRLKYIKSFSRVPSRSLTPASYNVTTLSVSVRFTVPADERTAAAKLFKERAAKHVGKKPLKTLLTDSCDPSQLKGGAYNAIVSLISQFRARKKAGPPPPHTHTRTPPTHSLTSQSLV
jgi:hypothetical protein